MKMKYVRNWLGVGSTVMLFLTCSFAAAADKVVVIPLGGGSDTQNVSVKVYDNSGQYLGLFIGNNGYVLEILVPTIGKILAVSQVEPYIITFGRGNIGVAVDWYYVDGSCQGTPYLKYSSNSENGSSYFGLLYLNKEVTSEFFASKLPPGEYLNMVSKRSQNGTGPCMPDIQDTWFSQITTYTAAEVGFSDPVTYPLQFITE